MWIAPPSGLRFISAETTTSVRFATSSRTRADAAPWPPFTARNAFVIAMVIFDGSNGTTAPLRRITLYCASRGSTFAGRALAVSPVIGSRAELGVVVAAEALGDCMDGSPRFLSLWPYAARLRPDRPISLMPERVRDSGRCTFDFPVRTPWRNAAWPGGADFPLLNQNLQHIVFKFLLNTKNSGVTGGTQVFFHAHGQRSKRHSETAHCGMCFGISPFLPGLVHRLVHSSDGSSFRPRPKWGLPTGSAKRKETPVRDRDDRFAGCGHDRRGGAGEAAERGQQRAALAEHEA